ncbi:probable proline--tRNA ligase, mitochondrial [Mya arenaria]|uniref:probable proline--tRNA ligase, mitochondrial n=1 Tax=Mya arenaria TaxID=6604 RepID=UPI0022E324A9|nr:probable proline--tRNA ligase, mitochondrial [Mya arenaria]
MFRKQPLLVSTVLLKSTEKLLHSFSRRNVSKRNYLSRMYLLPPSKLRDTGLTSKSQNLFLHNEILFPCHNGAFYYLPLGLRALEKLTRLIDEELQSIGAQKISMPTMVTAALWKKTGRWGTDELFKLKDRHLTEYCLGPTHEELVTSLVAQFERLSYKRFPLMLYQITRKFRDEMQPKFGLLRGREFEMKDLYTFDLDEETARETYSLVCDTYHTIFHRLQLNYMKVEGATGNIGGKMSHEYHLPASIGEDSLFICDKCGFGSNIELIDEQNQSEDVACPQCQSAMKIQTGIEVGHAFLLGTKYSEVLNAKVTNKEGKRITTEMGCYGLGVSRILQAGVEVLHDGESIRWPRLIAPYQVAILPQKSQDSGPFLKLSDELYDRLCSLPSLRHDVVIDDRVDRTIGWRKNQLNRQGFPYIIVVGKKCQEDPAQYELIDTYSGTTDFLSLDQLIDTLSMLHTL